MVHQAKVEAGHFSLKESFLRQVLLKIEVRLSITTSLVNLVYLWLISVFPQYDDWPTSLDELLHLDDGGQGELWKADGTGLRVEVFQYQVVQLVDQPVLKCEKQ